MLSVGESGRVSGDGARNGEKSGDELLQLPSAGSHKFQRMSTPHVGTLDEPGLEMSTVQDIQTVYAESSPTASGTYVQPDITGPAQLPSADLYPETGAGETGDALDQLAAQPAQQSASNTREDMAASQPRRRHMPSHARAPSQIFEVVQRAQDAPDPVPRRDRRLFEANALHAQHRGEALYEYGAFAQFAEPPAGEVAHMLGHTYGQKNVTWFSRMMVILATRRVPGSQWTFGQLIISVLFFLLNVLCLAFVTKPNSSEPDYKRGFGSLAAANTMLLIVPATRNSVLTWLLKLPFDQVPLRRERGARCARVIFRRCRSCSTTAHWAAGHCFAHRCTVSGCVRLCAVCSWLSAPPACVCTHRRPFCRRARQLEHFGSHLLSR